MFLIDAIKKKQKKNNKCFESKYYFLSFFTLPECTELIQFWIET